MDKSQQTVFLVDDDPSVLRTLSRGLSRRGFAVKAFSSAEGFLYSDAVDRPGCLILDLSMPEMNGLELQQALIDKGCLIPIIFITGHGGVPQSVKALRAGAIDFLEKPFEPEQLLERIAEAFEQDRKTRAERQSIEQLRSGFESLTKRELEVLHHLLSDPKTVTSRGIGRALGISHRTVELHRARILEKTSTSSLPELLSAARNAGIVQSVTD